MDNIDDYFDDDLVLDEQTLAILDREEQKYLSQVQQQRQPLPPVTKKLRTNDGWSPGVGSRMREADFDDLPEISITVDGSYGFTDPALTSTPVNSSQLKPRQLKAPQPRHQVQNGPATSHIQSPIPAARQITQSIQHRPAPVSNPTRARSATPSVQSRQNGVSGQPGLEKQLSELQAQLHELRNENQKIQDALKEATDVRYAKEGEVSILRKSIEKTAQKHAEEIAKMKAARAEADAKQKQMERQTKEETERLKTQFIFKQQELEASLRRPPASVRTTKVLKNAPATPIRVPSQIGAWRITQDPDAGRELDERTIIRQSPLSTRIGPRSPEAVKPPAFLPGFQNSFMTTPLKLGSKTLNKGKEKGIRREESLEVPNQIASQRPPLRAATPLHQRSNDSLDSGNPFDAALNSDGPTISVDGDGDTVMLDDVEDGIGEDPIKSFNYKAELSRIILTHTHLRANETTFQLLIGLPVAHNFSSVQAKSCTQACQALMLALSNPADDSDYAVCVYQVTKGLLVILQGLLCADPCIPAIALLNLLCSLVLSLPALNKILLSHGTDGGEDPLILATICDLVEHFARSSANIAKVAITEALSLLEIILCDITDETVTRLSLLSKRITSLVALLNASQPQEIIGSLSRLVLLLATYNTVSAQLATPMDDGNQLEDRSFKDSFLIHHLCVYLLESLNDDPKQNTAAHGNLVGCLAQLSLAQAEWLVKSHIVIPTLVYFVAHLSTALWNDDMSYLDVSQARLVIFSINQGLFLLHHLVYSPKPAVHLHEKLQHSVHRNLSNLVHMFVVGFGQLSYSEPPEWIDAKEKAELESLVEPARELLDLVVDGPEGDSIWAAYQMEPENESETDEEEREARRIENDIQS
ncbi:hypothetical protein P691DRAFT_722962 [Macrolepiota fuliginosa MF-IS2]|uniref:DNA repair protein Rad26 n=1 Tax=Macrolepiota fuliginosa MF-IS2 TaxID=1400762 RepID=A0A9P5XLK7_9AGAR|nr:hypothetical protein P691DRAFT_722962 [Macrolepiota fuliginosa MF-IS2]